MGRGGSNLGMVEVNVKGGIEGHQLRAAGEVKKRGVASMPPPLVDGGQQLVKAAGEVKRRGVVTMPPPLAGIRRGGQRRQRVPRSRSR